VGGQKLVLRSAVGLVLAGALAVVLASAATPAGARAPHVLAFFPKPLLGFAQDGSWIAWAQAPCGSLVSFRNLASGRTWTLRDHNSECAGLPSQGSVLGLSLGGRRAVWSTSVATDFYYTSLETAVVGSHPRTVVGETTWDGCGSGDLVQTEAADEGVAVYSYVNLNAEDPTYCTWLSLGGGVYSVVPDAQIRGLPPADALAVGDGLIAVIPVDSHMGDQRLAPRPNQPVYVYDTRTHSTQTLDMGSDAARGVAVSSSVVAVFAWSSAGHVIERFNPQTGALLGSTPFPANTYTLPLSVSGNRIVYSTPHGIWLLDGVSGKQTLIATTAAAPIGLNIDGNHVYWAENHRGRGRILTLKLP
jgi:hypothetical protein